MNRDDILCAQPQVDLDRSRCMGSESARIFCWVFGAGAERGSHRSHFDGKRNGDGG